MGIENFTFVTEFFLVGLASHRQTQAVLFLVFLLIYLVTVLGNLVIIILVQMNACLQTPMYFFLSNLALLELCLVTSIAPQMLAHLLTENRAISFTRCMVQMYISTGLGATECFLLAAMAYDRYLAVCHPLRYTIIMGRRRQLLLALGSWMSGFLLDAINVISILQLPFYGQNRINHFFCELLMVLKQASADTSVTEIIILCISSVMVFLVAVILISYGHIVSSVLKMRTTDGRRKAFSTCASHLAVVTLFYGTAIATYVTPRSSTDSDQYKKMAVFHFVVTPLLNPIIYSLRNKDIHAAVAKIVQRRGLQVQHKS